jgi:dephospho-CoA kinase
MPGAGKSTVANYLRKNSFYVLSMGDIIKEKALELNLDLNDKNLGNLMLNLREKKNDNGIVAKLMLEKIMELKNIEKIVVDGIRSYEEFLVFKKVGFAKLLAIRASSSKRYENIKTRNRLDTPENFERFSNRDKREISVGIRKTIALADKSIYNRDLSLEDLYNKVEKTVKEWLKEFNRIDR